VALPVLRHRLVTNYNADAEGFGSDRIIARLLESIPPHEGDVTRRPETSSVLKK
jgi:MoxR-like ATPase